MRILLNLLLAPLFVFGQGEQRYADGTATDQDGNTFEWISYGIQDWAIENAEVVTYRDGTPIPQETDATEWENLTTGAWCYYDNDPTKGKLYNWYAVMGIHDTDPNTPNKEFAPEGWHIPTDAEWTTLEEYLIANGYNYDGTTTENKIGKAMASTTGWDSSTSTGAIGNDQSLNNSSGFNAFPDGIRYDDVSFNFEGVFAVFWTSTELNANAARDRSLMHNGSGYLKRDWSSMQEGFSVRFVRDAVETDVETVIAVWDFTENTLGVTEFNSDFSTLNGSAAVGDNNLGFFGGATDQVGDGNDNARTLTHKVGGNGFTGTYMKPLALTSADLVDNKLHMSISFNSINIADGKLFKMFLKGPNSSNANNQVQRAIGIYLDQVNGVIQVKKVGPNNSQYGAAAIVGDLGATYDQSITLGVTLDWNAKTTDFWIGQPGGSDGLQNANNLSTGWTEATGDAAGYILDQLQFQVNLVDSSVEVDQIKFSTGSYVNTLSSDNIIKEQSFVRMYPNPADNYIIFNGIQDESKVDLFNITGQIVKSFDLVSSWDQVDISYIDKGVYFVSVNNGESTIKLIKK
jgi:uncharacterized protein (TIGR02145 family)